MADTLAAIADPSAASGTEQAAKAAAAGNAHVSDSSANTVVTGKENKMAHGHTSHHEMEEEEHHRQRTDHSSHSPFVAALIAAKDKALSGGVMFAGFAVLLTVCVKVVSLALGVPIPGASAAIASIIGTASAGALWMGGNEFFQAYKTARADENSRLNRAIDKVKDTVAHAKDRVMGTGQHKETTTAKDAGLLGAAAGAITGTVNGSIGTTQFEAQPVAATPAVNQTVQRILAEGPRSNASTIAASRSAALSAAERLQQQADAALARANLSV